MSREHARILTAVWRDDDGRVAPDSRVSRRFRSSVDLRQVIEEARGEVASATPEDGPYGELMATYVVLGELLDSDRVGAEYALECRALVDRLVVLGKANERYWEQRWAVWAAENTTLGGDVW